MSQKSKRLKKYQEINCKKFHSSGITRTLFGEQKKVKMSNLKETSLANKSMSHEITDDIVVVYDKKQDQRNSSCPQYKEHNEIRVNQYVVRLEDIPLPPEEWLSHKAHVKNDAKDCDPKLYKKSETSVLPPLEPESKLNLPVQHKHTATSVQSTSTTQFYNGIEEVESMKEQVREFRAWETVDACHSYGTAQINVKAESQEKDVSTGTFTIMSYNVLAQELLETHQYLYQKHNQRALSWDYRMGILFQEIEEANADILCLQEVQFTHLDLFKVHLNDLGYSLGMYKQRTNGKVDGCALFYKKWKFKLIESTSVEFYQNYEPGMSILDRDNVAIIARLQLQGQQDDGMQIVVATTHLLYNPRRHDIKLAQTQMLLAELERMAFVRISARTNKPKYWPVIVTGDFNLKPETAVYRFITEGFLNYSNLASRTLSDLAYGQANQDVLLPPVFQISSKSQHLVLLHSRGKLRHTSEKRDKEELKFLKIFNSDHHKSYHEFIERMLRTKVDYNEWETGYVSHGFNLKSVYPHRKLASNGKSMAHEASTYQKEWVTVDYIFYSEGSNNRKRDDHATVGSLKLISRYSLPTRDICHKLQHLPNLVCGSDHLPLVAMFLLTSDKA